MFSTGLKKQIENEMKNLNMDSVVEDISRLFSHEWAFVFAGARDFFIDKVCFNREGDLLVQVVYRT